MKECLISGAKTFGKLVFVNFLCVFIVLSISVITSNVFKEDIGYMVYGVAEGKEEPEFLYNHYFKDGEDTEKAKYEAEGYTEIDEHAITAANKTGDTVFLVITQLFCLSTLVVILYPAIWKAGTKDRNLVHFGHIAEDKLKGLKTGVVAVMPAFLLFAFFIATKGNISANFPAVWIKFLNANAYCIINILQNGAIKLSEVSVLRLVAMALTQITVPFVCWGAYVLGYKEISLADKIMYKKKEN